MRALLTILLASSIVVACDVLDPSLIPRDGGDGMVGDESPIEMDSGPPMLADTCTSRNPPVITSTSTFMVDTTDLLDQFSRIGCINTAAPGNEGFFKIEVQPGERWHFHLQGIGGGRVSNPSLYMTQDCDLRTCGNTSDLCGDNQDEHFSFIPDRPGTWFLGIDDGNAGGGQYRLLAFRNTCGDGQKEHGEACDDDNVMPGDGCDNACRVELAPNANVMESEPNDSLTDANVVRFAAPSGGSTTTTVSGLISGCPAEDFFVIKLAAAGRSIRAEMLNGSRNPCTTAPPSGIAIHLLDAAGTELGAGEVRAGNMCPTINEDDGFAVDLEQGAYFVQITGPVSETGFAYQLRLSVVDP